MPPKETLSFRAEDLGFYAPGPLEAFLCGKLASLPLLLSSALRVQMLETFENYLYSDSLAPILNPHSCSCHSRVLLSLPGDPGRRSIK